MFTQGKSTDSKTENEESRVSVASYKNDPDWESNKNGSEFDTSFTPSSKQTIESKEVCIVKENEVTEFLPELRLLLQVFEDKAWKFLFGEKYLIPLNITKDVLQTKLSLEEAQAEKLARYLIEPNNKSKLIPKNYALDSKDVMERMNKLVGNYK